MEFAVAELVSQGHTNNEVGRQLFISRHTVAFHLKKVYQKMSITSRVELAASWKQPHGGASPNIREYDDGGGRW